jgi:subfamily B ATP-binding cassette protein MsbA
VDSVERRFWRYVAAQWKPLVVALVCSVGVTAITGYTAYLLEQVIRSMDMRDAATLNRVSLTVLGVFALKWFFSYGQVYYLALAGQRLTAKLREDIFAHLQRLPLGFFQSRQVGAIQSIITNDVPVLQSAVLLVRDTLDAPLRIVAFLIYIFILNWRLALLALVFLPLIAVLIQRLGRQVHRITHQTQGALASVSALVQETLSGVRVIKTFAAEDREIERFIERNREVLHHSLRGERRRARLRPTVEFIGAASIALVLWFGGQEVARGQMTTAQLLSFLFLLHQIAQAASGVGAIQLTRKQVRAAAQRIFREALDVEPEAYDAPDAAAAAPPARAHRVRARLVSLPYRRAGAARGVVRNPARRGGRAGGAFGRGQKHAGGLAAAVLPAAGGGHSVGWARHPLRDAGEPALADWRRAPAHGAVRGHGRREHRLRQARRHPRGDRTRCHSKPTRTSSSSGCPTATTR